MAVEGKQSALKDEIAKLSFSDELTKRPQSNKGRNEAAE